MWKITLKTSNTLLIKLKLQRNWSWAFSHIFFCKWTFQNNYCEGVLPGLNILLAPHDNPLAERSDFVVTIGAIRVQWPQVSWLSFVQVMACRLLGTKPFTHPMLTFCQLYPKECILMKCWLKCASFHPWKCIWNAVCKISAILLWCQRVYGLWGFYKQ